LLGEIFTTEGMAFLTARLYEPDTLMLGLCSTCFTITGLLDLFSKLSSKSGKNMRKTKTNAKQIVTVWAKISQSFLCNGLFIIMIV
jgi:hypothetical protein